MRCPSAVQYRRLEGGAFFVGVGLDVHPARMKPMQHNGIRKAHGSYVKSSFNKEVVMALYGEQLFVGPLFYNLSFVHHENAVGFCDG